MDERKKQERILAFVSFCIEEYKSLHKMNGEAVAIFFEKTGVLDYLTEHYELLHTFGSAAILSDIEQFVNARRLRK